MDSFFSGQWLGTSDWARWTAVIGLLALLAGLVFLAWWALFADRAKGRRRCPRCWYDLAYTPGRTCPECGHTGRSEKEFSRTRRRWGLAILAMLAGSLVGGFIIDRAKYEGWMSYLPNTMLVWLLPVGGDANGLVISELDARMSSHGLSDEQWLDLLRRAVKGDFAARPGTEEWADKYGRIIDRWDDDLLGREDEEFRSQVFELLMSLPPQVELSTREVWPEDIGPTLNVAARHWWPRPDQMRLTATPSIRGVPGVEPDVHVLLDGPIQRRGYSVHLPPLEQGGYDLPITLKLERRSQSGERWQLAMQRQVEVSFDVTQRLDDMLEAVTDDDLDQAIRDVFANSGLVKYQRGGSLPVRVGLDPRPTYVEAFDGTAVGVRIEVQRNGQPGRMLDIWWHGGAGRFNRQHAWEVPFLDDEVLGAPDEEGDRWTLRIRGLPQLALRVRGVSKYWAGEVEVPTFIRRQRGSAGSRGWIPADDPVAQAAEPVEEAPPEPAEAG